MAYQVNKTDGSVVAIVPDGQVDQRSTSLTLIGKNYSGYGDALNENFVKLLEHFSSTTPPSYPIKGQIWYDLSVMKLKVYTGIEFVPVSSATVSTTQPSSLSAGDMWFNDADKQLFFYDGTNLTLLGPDYSLSQGVSGLKVVSLLDTLNQTRVVTYLYTNGILLGIFSKDTFTPKVAISGFTGSITPGFNAANVENFKFNVTCTNADSLDGQPAANFLRTNASNTTTGQLKVANDLGIEFGVSGTGNLTVDNGTVKFSNQSSNRSLEITVRKDLDQETAININPSIREINLYSGPDYTGSKVNIGGDLVVEGDLTVNGGTITVSSTELTIEDKNIVLGQIDNPSNSTADGGGITLLAGAGGDKTITWNSSTTAWTSSEHINLASSKYYAINGVPVITENSLGVSITSIPGVTSFGKQLIINVGPGTINDPAYLRFHTVGDQPQISSLLNGKNLVISLNNGNITLAGNPRITNLGNPIDAQDAVTKKYLDDTVAQRDIVFSMDLTDGKDNNYIITNILNNLAPPANYRNETRAKILCTQLTNSTTSLNVDPLVNLSTAQFNTPTGTAPAVTDVAISVATVQAPDITTTRIIKTFIIQNNVWTWVSDLSLPA